MVKRKTAKKIRKAHRYLGIFIGIQFIMWTVSGLYFSWTELDEIHGDHFRKEQPQIAAFGNLSSPTQLHPGLEVSSAELYGISGEPFYFINDHLLMNARTGEVIDKIDESQALDIAARFMKDDLEVENIELITETGKHHEYREKLLPAYVISYEGDENLKAYIGAGNGSFQTVRHRNWRWFDFLWMTHTMDYEGRDDFNNSLLRAFSLLGLITVLSGFLLWYISSPTVRKVVQPKKKNKKKAFQAN
ncbi:PepSY domain-containing protein [Gramella sp. GC03-9]|uniref:PepSY domain-containing protein n=1 Tax=Christiangramia oceanisediminis TaxID=2920386 RepID=A0A9X2I4G9_9FLAO|nr:PepSY domain-containing protein [Gramella oceanisediminis]